MCIKCAMVHLSGEKFDDLEPEVMRIAKLIHSGKLKPGQIDKEMTAKIAEQLMKGIFKGYGKKPDSKGITPKQSTFLDKLNTNVYVFSGFKNYHMLKEATLLLKNDKGKLKSFPEFLDDVKQVNETYNEVYLAAEYSTAVASAQMAQSWQDYEDNGVEMLTYQTAGDDRVRDEHAILEGITEPLDSDFWETYYPPNDWGCRCDAVPTTSDKRVSIAKGELPDIPPMFQNNVGQSGVVFPDTHPYFDVQKAISAKIRDQVDDLLNDEEE